MCVASDPSVGFRDDDADRRLLRSWCGSGPAGVGAQKLRLVAVDAVQKKVSCILRAGCPSEIQRVILVVGPMSGPGDGETHVAAIVDHLADRMDAAALGRRLADRQRRQLFGCQPRRDRGVLSSACAPSASVTRFFSPLMTGPSPAVPPALSPSVPGAPTPSPCQAPKRAPLRSPARRKRLQSRSGTSSVLRSGFISLTVSPF